MHNEKLCHKISSNHQKGASAHTKIKPQKMCPLKGFTSKNVPFEKMRLKKCARPKEEWLQSILPA